MDKEIKVNLTKKLANDINIEYRNINWLLKALYSKPINYEGQGENNSTYQNESLATLGDTVIKKILVEYYYDKGMNKKEITEAKEPFEKNEYFKKLNIKYNLNDYTYNDENTFSSAPLEAQLPHPDHDFIVEAIVGAIYKDRGIRYTTKWVLNFLEVK